MDPAYALLLSGLLLAVVASVLKRHRLAVEQTREAREMEVIEQLTQPRDRMSQPVASSQSTLQPVNGRGGLDLAGAAFAAHVNQFGAGKTDVLRGSEAKGEQTL
jgi:hypothetical protein